MLILGVKSDLDKVAKQFGKLGNNQVPFATMLALNRTASLAKSTLVTSMDRIFDRPVPFTKNSLFVRSATKTNLVARVEHKEFAGKGTPASKYLRAEIEGGSRRMKRSEKLLGHFWTPSKHVKLDAWGNVPGPLLTKILSTVQAFQEGGFRANITNVSKGRQRKRGTFQDFYIMQPGNARGLRPGIYQRLGDGRHVPILFFLDSSPSYRPRYDMTGIVERVVQAEFGRQFAAAMDFALATAKLKL